MRSFIDPRGSTVIKLILRSPLHSLLSQQMILVSLNGSSDGQAEWKPARYLLEGQRVTFFSERAAASHLKNSAVARILLRGSEVSGQAEFITDMDAMRYGFARIYQRLANMDELVQMVMVQVPLPND